MGELIVGSRDCSFYRVEKIMLSAGTPENHILRTWPELATVLELNFITISKLKQDFLMDKKSLEDVVLNMLSEWKMRQGSAATLLKLIECINTVGLRSISDQLRREFQLPSNFVASKVARPCYPQSISKDPFPT